MSTAEGIRMAVDMRELLGDGNVIKLDFGDSCTTLNINN